MTGSSPEALLSWQTVDGEKERDYEKSRDVGLKRSTAASHQMRETASVISDTTERLGALCVRIRAAISGKKRDPDGESKKKRIAPGCCRCRPILAHLVERVRMHADLSAMFLRMGRRNNGRRSFPFSSELLEDRQRAWSPGSMTAGCRLSEAHVRPRVKVGHSVIGTHPPLIDAEMTVARSLQALPRETNVGTRRRFLYADESAAPRYTLYTVKGWLIDACPPQKAAEISGGGGWFRILSRAEPWARGCVSGQVHVSMTPTTQGGTGSERGRCAADPAGPLFRSGTRHDAQLTYVSAIPRQLLFQQSTNIQTRGLLVSLFIKACGVAERQADPLEVVLRRQQLVVNATEEFHAAQTIHASALNVAAAERDRLDPLVLDDVQTGNKMTVLAGDFFFAKAFQTTTDIGIPVMLDVFGKAVEDYVRSYFESDLKEAPFVDAMWWESKTHLKTASLLASAYRAAAMVAGHQKELQEQVYRLGKHIALALQTYHETRQFLDTPHSTGLDYDVTSLPIVLHMETHPHVLSHLKESGMKNLQFSQLQSEVLSGDALERAQVMLGYYIQEARLLARDLGSSDAADSLVTIVSSLKDL
ncbi:hypothetical protein HPB52_004837 [Rhipicephalus sanguineus]|uniref:Uncharacterized protein n=1 Tax=Rhipicephalus sanguineus TaxID=34632 RepID=A0A9D4PQC1_RHISA|nr:hypothetical protein HPB52_004837 [Rhipicephalus sanguineus]